MAVDFKRRNQGQYDTGYTENQGNQIQQGPDSFFFSRFAPGQRQKKQKKCVADDAPNRNRQPEQYGIRALGNRITVNRLGDGTKAAVGDVRIHPVMGYGQIDGIDQSGNGEHRHCPKIYRKWKWVDRFAFFFRP